MLDPVRRACLALVHESEQLAPLSKRARREEGELDVEQPLAVGEPCLWLSALERAENLLHRALTCRAVALELEPELHHGREVALIEGHLPVATEAAHLAQERLEEVGVEVPPRARHLLVEPAPARREAAERQPAGAELGEPPRHVAPAV